MSLFLEQEPWFVYRSSVNMKDTAVIRPLWSLTQSNCIAVSIQMRLFKAGIPPFLSPEAPLEFWCSIVDVVTKWLPHLQSHSEYPCVVVVAVAKVIFLKTGTANHISNQACWAKPLCGSIEFLQIFGWHQQSCLAPMTPTGTTLGEGPLAQGFTVGGG